MHDAISFGAIWTVWFRGWHPSFTDRSEVKYLRSHPEDYRLHFGCMPEYVTSEVPAQISWSNADPETWCFDEDVVDIEILDDKVLHGWKTFCDSLLHPALEAQRVVFQVCGPKSPCSNYYDYAKMLASQGRIVANYL